MFRALPAVGLFRTKNEQPEMRCGLQAGQAAGLRGAQRSIDGRFQAKAQTTGLAAHGDQELFVVAGTPHLFQQEFHGLGRAHVRH